MLERDRETERETFSSFPTLLFFFLPSFPMCFHFQVSFPLPFFFLPRFRAAASLCFLLVSSLIRLHQEGGK